MSEFPPEFSHIKSRSTNGESTDTFGAPKKSSPLLNKAFGTDKMSSLLSSKKSSQMQQQQNCSSSSNSELFRQQENRNFSRSVSVTSSSSSGMKMMSSAQQQQQQQQQQRAYSVEEVDDDGNTVVTISGGSSSPPPQELRFEQKSSNSSSHSLLSADGYTAEKSAASNKELKRLQAGDLSYEEKRATSAMKAKLEGEGFCAEKMASVHQEQKQLKSGDTLQQQQRKAMTSAVKLSTDEYTAEKRAMSKQEERQMFSQGVMHQERNISKSSKMAFSSSSSSTSTSSSINHKSLQNVSDRCMSTSPIGDQFALPSSTQRLAITQGVDEDLEILYLPSHPTDTEKAMARMRARMEKCVDSLKKVKDDDEASNLLSAMNEMICRAWAVPTIGYDLGFSMCNILRNNGALDILIENCSSESDDLQFRSAQVLEQCLSTENRTYVVERGLDRVVRAACSWRTRNSVKHSRVGIGILEHLFKHSETTCDDVVRLGGLETVLYECRTKDVETLRHCAAALANLSLYGGPDNQKAMIKSKVPVWLFPLAFHFDDNIKYYACLAIAALVANKEIEAAVLRSGTLDLVEPFVSTHSPEQFANSTVAHVHGQSKSWLMKLVPVLNSTREEARSLAAFHFAMEAGIKKRQGNTAVSIVTSGASSVADR